MTSSVTFIVIWAAMLIYRFLKDVGAESVRQECLTNLQATVLSVAWLGHGSKFQFIWITILLSLNTEAEDGTQGHMQNHFIHLPCQVWVECSVSVKATFGGWRAGFQVFCGKAEFKVYYQGWNRSPAQVGCMRQALRAGALGRPRGMGWGTHVTPWLVQVNVWQKPLQYCKEISLQLIKISGKKNIKK